MTTFWNSTICTLLLATTPLLAAPKEGPPPGMAGTAPTIKELVAAQAAWAKDRVWEPTRSTGAKQEAFRARIVSYGGKWTRHDYGGHAGGGCMWRYATPRYPGLAWTEPKGTGLWMLRVSQNRDVDGDGKTDDDICGSLDFSLEEQLGIVEWPQSYTVPERESARLYGGASWRVANSTKPSFWTEMGINCDHSNWQDVRAEDHPLNGCNNDKVQDSFHRHYWAIVWKKEDFLNDGNRWQVRFDDTSRLASVTTRGYWQGYDDVRFIVLDGDQWYVSEPIEKDANGAPLPDPSSPGGTSNKTYGSGRLWQCYPTKTKWGRYTPKGDEIEVAPNLPCAPHEFKDVRAVGWYLAKNNKLRIESHIKWYGFEADAVVVRPAYPSTHVAMAEVPATAAVPAFYMATCETPYEVFRKIHRWGDSPFWTLEGRFIYRNTGAIGSMQRPLPKTEYSQREPVTSVCWYDMLAWCNTLSMYEGREPVYYEDPEFKTVFRNMHIGTRVRGEKDRLFTPKLWTNPIEEEVPEPKIYVKWAADGFRLPTTAEWLQAYRAGGSKTEQSVAGGKTQPVASRAANKLGIYDLLGNVWEPVWQFGDCYDPAAAGNAYVVLGGDFQSPTDPTSAASAGSDFGDVPYEGAFNIGLRLVSRKPGLGAPSQGPSVKASGSSMLEGAPAWCFSKDTRTGVRQKEARRAQPLVPMIELPAGIFNRSVTKDRAPILVENSVHPVALGRTEVTYEQWIQVVQWATAHGYSFDRDGDMGSMYYYSYPHRSDEPVVHISWWDVLAWCNALSEWEGRTPVFYTDEGQTQVYRKAKKFRPLKTSGAEFVSGTHPWKEYSRDNQIWLFPRWDADGYRLPTKAEWDWAIQDDGKTDSSWGSATNKAQYGWDVENSGGRTHPVAQLKPSPKGFYDLFGNVTELTMSAWRPHGPQYLDLNNPKEDLWWSYKIEKGWDARPATAGVKYGGSSWMKGGPIVRNRSGYILSDDGYLTPENVGSYYPDVGFRVARAVAAPFVEIDGTRYSVVGPLRDKFAALNGRKVSYKGVIRLGTIELTEVQEVK